MPLHERRVKLLISGGRDYGNRALMYRKLRALPVDTIIIHGDCPCPDCLEWLRWRGNRDHHACTSADRIADTICHGMGPLPEEYGGRPKLNLEVRVYHADWDRLGQAQTGTKKCLTRSAQIWHGHSLTKTAVEPGTWSDG